jgi:hypothetical protein
VCATQRTRLCFCAKHSLCVQLPFVGAWVWEHASSGVQGQPLFALMGSASRSMPVMLKWQGRQRGAVLEGKAAPQERPPSTSRAFQAASERR